MTSVRAACGCGDRLHLANLLGGYIAYPKVLNQARSLHFHEHAERFRDRAWRRRVQATNPQIDHIKGVELEVCEVIINSFPELVGCERSRPISFRVPARTDLGDDP